MQKISVLKLQRVFRYRVAKKHVAELGRQRHGLLDEAAAYKVQSAVISLFQICPLPSPEICVSRCSLTRDLLWTLALHTVSNAMCSTNDNTGEGG